MSGVNPEPLNDRVLLSDALKAVRAERRMSRAEVAVAMNMATRTYARFESGEIRPNLDYINRFAVATHSDPQAIHLAVAIGSPELARRACDNQLGTVFLIGLEQFNARQGDRIRDLSTRQLIEAIVRMFGELAELEGEEDPARKWLDEGGKDLRAKRPKPGR
jgi:transcriptional regulator with XRE-family HTH domain